MISKIDFYIISLLRACSIPLARISLFVVFFWFGALKLVHTSPANPLVEALLSRTLPFLTFEQFIFWFGVYEMTIGIAFLVPKLERIAIVLLIPHMITTALPLVLLPQITWQSFLTPTLEGQYIIKNCVIVALAFSIAARLQPIKTTPHH
ncbi:MAG: hypothetical protein HY617_03370 [Candidatus Sungbacteria bacterium]|nr:hypothetical protein [Candidatus Sungbacteria bacterium]